MKSYSEFYEFPWLSWLVLSVIGILFLVTSALGYLKPLQNIFGSISAVPKQTFYDWGIDINTYFAFWDKLPSLQQENMALQQQVIELQGKLSTVEGVFSENERLRNEVGITYDRNYKQIGARVIGRQKFSLGILEINKGSADGIKVGSAVVVENILVGQVIEVAETSSSVRAITSEKSLIPVKVKEINIGVLTGVNNSILSIINVLNTSGISVGDKIYTSGIDGDLPANLFIGTVAQVNSDSRLTASTVDVNSALNFTNLQTLKVLVVE